MYPCMYHIVNRGEERRKIFLKPEDYNTFLNVISLTFYYGIITATIKKQGELYEKDSIIGSGNSRDE